MKKKLLTILIAILISLMVVVLKLSFSQCLPGQTFGMSGLIEKKNVDTLYIGSSMFKQGLDPNEIGDDDYILAYNGNEPTNILVELEYLLNQGVVVKNLYIDMYPWTAIRGPWIDDLKILWDIDLNSILETKNQLGNAATALYSYEFYVSSNNDYLLSYPISVNILNSYYLKGGNNYNSSSASKDYLESIVLSSMVYSEDEIDYRQAEAIKEINNLCLENSINLLFLETPKYYRESNWDRYINLMNQYTELLDSINVKYILQKDVNFDNTNSDYFIDVLHMSSLGAKEYTKLLQDIK